MCKCDYQVLLVNMEAPALGCLGEKLFFGFFFFGCIMGGAPSSVYYGWVARSIYHNWHVGAWAFVES
jgi:hypothetical protein